MGPSRRWSSACLRRAARGRCASYLLAVLVPLAGGCSSNHGQLIEFLRAHDTEVSTGQYAVRPPDVIAIHSADVPEVDGAQVALRPDGKITLRLLGEIDVAGLTTEEITSKLKAQLSRYYVDPEVMVEVAAHRSQFYYVFGEVDNAGPKPFTGRDTVLRALAEAQPTFLAWESNISVVRPAPDEQNRKVIKIDLDDMVEDGDVSKNVLLQEGDVIYVPPTILAWIGNHIREVLYPVGPVLNAYTTPASGLLAHQAYEDEFDDDDQGRDRRFWPR